MTDDSYPSLYQSADSASLRGQKLYLRLNKFYFCSLVLASLISASTVVATSSLNSLLYTVLAIVLVLGLLLLGTIRLRQDEKVWFDGRAVAESTKTGSWRFMMRVYPFDDDANAEATLLANLKEIRDARPHLAKHLAAGAITNGASITPYMKNMRAAPLDDRRASYLRARIVDQLNWYRTKAQSNANSGAKWFWLIALLQGLIAVFAVVQAAAGGLGMNPIPIVTTCAAAMAAWNQLKRHEELGQSYALAAQELEHIEAIAPSQSNEQAFSQLVEQAENSISREHTMWCARRDVRLPNTGAPRRMGGESKNG